MSNQSTFECDGRSNDFSSESAEVRERSGVGGAGGVREGDPEVQVKIGRGYW
jgi:hypothetical protein